MKLALGTAQFGLAYGITNTQGQITADESARIIGCARAGGLDTIDTAIAYGQSEERLGEVGVNGWHIVSKLPTVPEGCANVQQWVTSHVDASLARLNVSKLRGLLLHRPDQLLAPNGRELYLTLVHLKETGKVEKIGISIYEPAELDELYSSYAFDIVQAPFNVFDRRLFTSGWLQRLHADHVEIHVRSVFLQGLLLLSAGTLPAGFERWAVLWDRWKSWVAVAGLNPLQAALGHIFSYPEIDRVIVGVDSLNQLKEILTLAETEWQRAPESLETTDVALLNPAHWLIFRNAGERENQ